MVNLFNRKEQSNSDKKNTGIKNYLKHHPYLWRFDRESVSRGVAVGLFTAIVSFIPFQTLIAIFLAILLRANLPTAFLISWISNPITILPIAYFTSRIGAWILHEKTSAMTINEYHWQLTNFSSALDSFTVWIVQFGKAYLVGLPFVSIILALLGYIIVFTFWNIGKCKCLQRFTK